MNRNLEMLETVAQGFKTLRNEVVFVGGAVTGLYADDPAAPEVRPTADVDCVIEISSRAAYHRMEDQLRRFGFVNDISEGAPLCRWVYRGVRIDVMPNDPAILGFSNRWYDHARENSSPFRLSGGATIRILRAPVFLQRNSKP